MNVELIPARPRYCPIARVPLTSIEKEAVYTDIGPSAIVAQHDIRWIRLLLD